MVAMRFGVSSDLGAHQRNRDNGMKSALIAPCHKAMPYRDSKPGVDGAAP